MEGFPGGSVGKESACNAEDLGLSLGLGRSPGEGNGSTLQYSGLENSVDCIVQGVVKSWTWLSKFRFHFHFLSMEFSRQGYWSGLPFPSPRDLPNSGIKPGSPALKAVSLPSETPEKPENVLVTQLHITLSNPMDCSPRLFYPWNSLGKNTGVNSHSLLQGIFPSQGWNPSPEDQVNYIMIKAPIPSTSYIE